VLVDLCGGICTALEAVLQLGYHVNAYAYADVDPMARIAAHHRVANLSHQYFSQVPSNLTETFLDWVPQHITDIHPAHVTKLLHAFPGSPVLLVCGWPCQDLSPAGPNTGLTGQRSSLVFTVIKVLNMFIAQHTAPVGNFLENSATQHNLSACTAA